MDNKRQPKRPAGHQPPGSFESFPNPKRPAIPVPSRPSNNPSDASRPPRPVDTLLDRPTPQKAEKNLRPTSPVEEVPQNSPKPKAAPKVELDRSKVEIDEDSFSTDLSIPEIRIQAATPGTSRQNHESGTPEAAPNRNRETIVDLKESDFSSGKELSKYPGLSKQLERLGTAARKNLYEDPKLGLTSAKKEEFEWKPEKKTEPASKPAFESQEKPKPAATPVKDKDKKPVDKAPQASFSGPTEEQIRASNVQEELKAKIREKPKLKEIVDHPYSPKSPLPHWDLDTPGTPPKKQTDFVKRLKGSDISAIEKQDMDKPKVKRPGSPWDEQKVPATPKGKLGDKVGKFQDGGKPLYPPQPGDIPKPLSRRPPDFPDTKPWERRTSLRAHGKDAVIVGDVYANTKDKPRSSYPLPPPQNIDPPSPPRTGHQNPNRNNTGSLSMFENTALTDFYNDLKAMQKPNPRNLLTSGRKFLRGRNFSFPRFPKFPKLPKQFKVSRYRRKLASAYYRNKLKIIITFEVLVILFCLSILLQALFGQAVPFGNYGRWIDRYLLCKRKYCYGFQDCADKTAFRAALIGVHRSEGFKKWGFMLRDGALQDAPSSSGWLDRFRDTIGWDNFKKGMYGLGLGWLVGYVPVKKSFWEKFRDMELEWSDIAALIGLGRPVKKPVGFWGWLRGHLPFEGRKAVKKGWFTAR